MTIDPSYPWFLFFILLFPFSDLMQGSASGEDADYGDDTANTAVLSSKQGTDSFFNYLELHDHIGPSGVPLGGMGVGCFDLAASHQYAAILPCIGDVPFLTVDNK
jgi:hypothetical protein